MDTIQVTLNQKQANLVLRALELLEADLYELEEVESEATAKRVEADRLICRQLWNNICTMGLDAHFGGKQ